MQAAHDALEHGGRADVDALVERLRHSQLCAQLDAEGHGERAARAKHLAAPDAGGRGGGRKAEHPDVIEARLVLPVVQPADLWSGIAVRLAAEQRLLTGAELDRHHLVVHGLQRVHAHRLLAPPQHA